MSFLDQRVSTDNVDVAILGAIQRAQIVDAYDFIEFFFISDFHIRCGIKGIDKAIKTYLLYSQLYKMGSAHDEAAKEIAKFMRIDVTEFLKYLSVQNPRSTVVKFFLCDFYPRMVAICRNPMDPTAIAQLPREIMWDDYPAFVNYVMTHHPKSPENLSLDIRLCDHMNEAMRLVHQHTGVKGLFHHPKEVNFLKKTAAFFNYDIDELRAFVGTLDRSNRAKFEKSVYNFGLRLDLFAANPSDPANIERIAKHLKVTSADITEYLAEFGDVPVATKVSAIEDFDSIDTLMHLISSRCNMEDVIKQLLPGADFASIIHFAVQLRKDPPKTYAELKNRVDEQRLVLSTKNLTLST